MEGLFKKVQKFWEFGSGRTLLAAFCAHSVSVSIGICQGYSAILIPQLTEAETFGIKAGSEEVSWIASLGAITNPIGSVLSGLLAEYVGRKRSMQISLVPFIIGSILLGMAEDVSWIFAGRLITGIAAGMSTACYTYVSEICTPEQRGFFQSLGPISASFGILFTYISGYLLNWRIVAIISISFSLFSLISLHFLPESPGYLLRQNKPSQSFQAYFWLRRSNAEAETEIERHKQISKQKESQKISLKEIYFGPQTIKPFFMLVSLFLLQELSGIYTILFYAVDFFKEANMDLDEYIASILVGIIRFSMSIVAGILINKFGRKVLCTSSNAGMALTMLTVASYVKYYEINFTEDKIFRSLPLLGIILNVFFSMLGMLPIPWILVGELFPLEVRPIMCGIVICIAQCFIFICVKVYNDMLIYLTFSGTLFLFSAASIVGVLFCNFVLVETKNKSLHEIEEGFRNTGDEEVLKGIDNKAFVISPGDEKFKRSGSLYTVEVINI